MAVDDYTDVVHTGPGTLAGRYMRTFWHPVYRSEDLQPGHAVQIQIMSEHLTLYRGEGPFPNPSPARGGPTPPPSLAEPALSALRTPSPDSSGHSESLPKGKGDEGLGKPHLLAQRCAHRGTQLSVGWVEGDDIRCFYHGWKYDGLGQCIEQPGEDESFTSRVKIRSYPTREYVGLIFAYLGEGDPPPPPRWPEFEDPGVLDVYPPEYWPCNYFNRIDNACDLAHLSFAHRESRRAIDTLQAVPAISAEETEYGIITRSTRPGKPTTMTHFHMPNVNQFITESDLRLRDPLNPSAKGRLVRLLFRVPVDDERCVSFPIDHVSLVGDAGGQYLERRRSMEVAQRAAPETPEDMAEAVLANRLTTADVRAHDPANLKTLTSVEDYVAQVGQGPIVNHPAERLGRMDVGVMLVRQIWQRELRALAEGQQLKGWSRTQRLEGVVG